MGPSPAGAGFTLLEVVVALAILSLALMLGLSVLAQQPRIQRHLRAHQQAHAALGATLEGLRAGTVPPASGTVDPSLYTGLGSTAADPDAPGPGPPGLDRPVLGRPKLGRPDVTGSSTPPPPGSEPARAGGPTVRLMVVPDPDRPGLSRAEVTAVYTVDGRVFQRRVVTMIWVGP